MLLQIRQLKFSLPDNPFGSNAEKLAQLSEDLKKFSNTAGTLNSKFRAAFGDVYKGAKERSDIESVITSKIHLRALAIALKTDVGIRISITQRLLDKIPLLTNRPSSLLVDSLYDYFLLNFEKLQCREALSLWLIRARRDRNLQHEHDKDIIAASGPRWLATSAIDKKIDFDQYLQHLKLDRYASGQFMTLAKQFYYVEQLKTIPLNEANDILTEVQSPSVFGSKYDEHALLGHQILTILIERAPHSDIADSWMNVIMSIAGDPRIPTNHPKYIKWWSHLPPELISKVRGWLSKLDLRLFLEALEDYSISSGKADIRRMYPARKRFLEGLFDAGLITHTRLYLNSAASYYLKKHYNSEHLPSYSNVDGDKSIIHVQLGDRHLIEGSHSCYLWIYKSLSPSAVVLNYSKTSVDYYSLTTGLSIQTKTEGHVLLDKIQHNPANFYWQRQAIKSLKSMHVPVSMKQILTKSDYDVYVRRFGVE